MSQTITITGTGDVGYYGVKIYYENDMLHPYSITVNGSFATIDVSSFQEGYYTIFISLVVNTVDVTVERS